MAKNKVEDLIIRARVRMLLKAPFFGNLATRLEIVDASNWVPTAATDGKHLYYNAKFFELMNKEELVFVVAHEVMHAVYDHGGRRGSRDPRLWNCAADYVINLELHEQRIGKMPTSNGIKCLFDTKYRNMCAEEVYDSLKQDQEDGKGDDNADSFDTHLDPDSSDSGAGEGDGQPKDDPTGKNGPIPMDENERKMLKDDIKQAVMQSAKAAGASNCPGGVKKLIKDFTEPQMDWREILNCSIQSTVKADYTFTRINRKTQHGVFVLPGQDNDFELEVDIAIDTSGSISHTMLRDFLSEIQGIMEQFPVFKLSVWTFDTNVYNRQKFTQDTIDELADYDIQGNGGTDFDVNWTFMKENGIEPHRFIMMTDGYPWNSWGDPDYCDTVFLIHGNDSIVAPFGTTCYYKEDNS